MPITHPSLFGERHAHPAAAASVVQHAVERAHAGLLEVRQHLRASPVLEYRVVVFGSEPHGGVFPDRLVVDNAHA